MNKIANSTVKTLNGSQEIISNIQRFKLQDKPVLISGRALEYYGIRQPDERYDADYDFIISQRDYEMFKDTYPDNLRDIYGDLGVTVGKWKFGTGYSIKNIRTGKEVERQTIELRCDHDPDR